MVVKQVVGGLIITLVASALSGAQTYKWTDANGQVHFSSSPPPEIIRQSQAEVVGSTQSQKSSGTMRDVLYKDWYTLIGNQKVMLRISDLGFNWSVMDKNDQQLVEDHGSAEQLKDRFILTSKKLNGKTRTFIAKHIETAMLDLVDADTEQSYRYRCTCDNRRALSKKEEFIEGKWAEFTGSTETLSGKISFQDDGTFYRYFAAYGEDPYYESPYPKKIAEGFWALRNDVLTLTYTVGNKHLWDKTGKEEEWSVQLFDYRTLKLEKDGATLLFRRKRDKLY